MQVTWRKCQNEGDVTDHWCSFENLTISDALKKLYGVYIIWTGTNARRVSYVGEGIIGERVQYHRDNTNIPSGSYVTWAKMPNKTTGESVETYLIKTLNPSLNQQIPYGSGTPVNLPWD